MGMEYRAVVTGVYIMKMYAGAAKCDLKAGVYVGDVKVTYNPVNGNGSVTVEWLPTGIPTGTDYSSAHWYAGNTTLARTKSGRSTIPTVTPPGQFPVVQSSVGILPATRSLVIPLFPKIYVTIHGSLCFTPKILI